MSGSSEMRKASGLCVNCGIRPPQAGRTLCFTCSMASHEAYERKKQRLGIHQGIQGLRWIYTVWQFFGIHEDGTPDIGEKIFTGTAKEAAAYISCHPEVLASAARSYKHILFKKYYITRERIVNRRRKQNLTS